MEKRFITAVVLSFFVLYAWSAMNPPPAQNRALNNSQVIENKEDASYTGSSISPKIDIKASPSPINDFKEEEKEIITDNFTLTFTNKGGKLTKVWLNKYDEMLPVAEYGSVSGYEQKPFVLVETGDPNTITYVHTGTDITVEKEYLIDNESDIINSIVRFTYNGESKNVLMDIDYNSIVLDMSILEGMKSDSNLQRNLMLYEYSILEGNKVERKNNANKFKDKETKRDYEDVKWVAFRNRYYAVVNSTEGAQEYFTETLSERSFRMGARFKSLNIMSGSQATISSSYYVGPQLVDQMKQYEKGFEKVISYNIGSFFDVFALGLGDPAARFILKVMKVVHNITKSWGFSIILVAMMICAITYPLTMNSMKSMRKMQVLQPEMNKIKEKHKDNPQKMNKEMMDFYKSNNVNPLAGCLPMFIQMPIFFGIIQLLWRYVAIKGEPFLWIKDLSLPDRLFILPFSLPFFGNEFNLLPIIVFFLTILQQVFSSKNIVVTDPNMAMQQKMMKFMLPAMIILFFYKWASALALYFTVFYLYQTLIQWKLSKERSVE